MAILNIKAPVAGMSRQTGFQSQPPFTTFRSINMWPKDVISGRQVSATRPPLVLYTSPGSAGTPVNLLANVNGDATQTPQFSMVSARNGTLYWWNGTSWTSVTSGVTVTTGRPVSAHAFLKRVVIMNNTTPLVFNYADLTMVNYVASVGTIPSDCRIVTAAFGGVWIAGERAQPHVFSGSRTGSIFDWDFSVAGSDLGGAYTSSGEDEGFILEPITAMIPLNSDTLIIACVDEMWALRGHPRRGGILEKLPDKIGVLGFTAWTKGPDGEVYFLSRLGVGVLDAAGTRPTLLSKKVIPAELIGLPYNYLNPTACLEYNPLWNGVHVTVRDEQLSWWMDLNEKISFHEEVIEDYPYVTNWFGSIETEAAAGVLYGGDDGISRFDSEGLESTLSSELLTGPFRISKADLITSKVTEIDYRFLSGTSDSENTTVAVITGANGDDVVSRYENELQNFRTTTQMDKLLRNGGRARSHLSGAAAGLVMQAFNGDRIVFEGAELVLEPHGRNVWIPRQTEFEAPSTAVTIGLGWTLGGVYATATGTAPTANLTNFNLWVDLSEMPAGWWSEVAPDGRDIRGTTSNNALCPIDLVDFDYAGQDGFLVVRMSVTSGVAPVVRVWCGNPLASFAPAGGPFGQYNAYPSTMLTFYPDGGGNDRSRNKLHLVSQNSVTFGNQTGPNAAYPISTQYTGHATASLAQHGVASARRELNAFPAAIIGYINMIAFSNSTFFHPLIAAVDENDTLLADCGFFDPVVVANRSIFGRVKDLFGLAFSDYVGGTSITDDTFYHVAYSKGATLGSLHIDGTERELTGGAVTPTTLLDVDRVLVGAIRNFNASAQARSTVEASLLELHNANLSAAWLDYSHTRSDVAGFWGPWTLG